MALGDEISGRSSNSGRNSQSGTSKIDTEFNFLSAINAKKEAKNLDIILGLDKQFYSNVNKLAEQSNLKRIEKQLKSDKISVDRRAYLERQYAAEKEDIEKKALNAISIYAENLSKKSSAVQRLENAKSAEENLKRAKEALEQEYALKMALANQESSEMKKLEEEKNARMAMYSKLELDAIRKRQQLEKTTAGESLKSVKEGFGSLKEGDLKEGVKKIFQGSKGISLDNIVKSLGDKNKQQRENISKKEARLNELNDQEDTPENQAEKQQLESEVKDDKKSLLKNDAVEQLITTIKEEKNFLKKSLQAITSAISDSYNQAFKEAETFLTTSAGHMNARLQGSETNYKEIVDLVSKNLAISPYAQQSKVLEKIREATDLGIAYNLEQRAFLSEISDKIANTFDAFDANLLRIIRLQQADSTAARLGMESALTRFLNSMYQDTSYLNEGFDTVSAALVDAESQVTQEQAAEFEFMIQKWLGSLSSLGLSSSAVTNIAQGINYLSTGDVTSLANNTSLQTLFAMSASRAGMSYAEILTQGLNSTDINKLLKSMVEYLKEIAENSDNKVVRSAYGGIFNLSTSDFRAITNLSNEDIETVFKSNLSYDQLIKETNNQFKNLAYNRLTIPEMLSNVYNNAIYGVASDWVNNPALWAINKMLDFANSVGADISIPFVNAAGFGFDANATVLGILNMSTNIARIFTLMGNIISGLASNSKGGLNLEAWGGSETTARGNVSGLLKTMTGGISESQETSYKSNMNPEDVTKTSLNESVRQGEENNQITGKGTETEQEDAKNANKALASASSLSGNGESWIYVQDSLLSAAFINSYKAIRVFDEPFTNMFTNLFGCYR